MASYNLPHGFSVGAAFRLVSGSPQTPIIGAVYDADSDDYLGLSGPTNSDRLPTFHQLDLRVDKTFTFRKWQLMVYLDIKNVYNRRNAEFVRYNFDYTERTYLYGLPFLPNIGILAEF